MVADAETPRVSAGHFQHRATWKPPVRISLFLVVAAALAGCNANPEMGAPMNTAGPFAVKENPYNPVSYAQTTGFYHGGR
jgi:hypothetical protein